MIHPAFFHGDKKRHSYFEGWYFKCISADRQHAIAIIPGMAVDPKGEKHAFVQVINAVSGKTWYFHFPYDQFHASKTEMLVSIGLNTFQPTGMKLTISTSEGQIAGQLQFLDIRPFPTSALNPGIMGPFSFIPMMECYHAIVHLAHHLSGEIILDGETLDFTGGTGYIEKDYGRSFPKDYLWLQASHFEGVDASFVFSRAHIPFMGRHFQGFFAYLTDFKTVQCRFATYNFAKLEHWQVDPEAGTCSAQLAGRSGILTFTAEMAGGGKLRAPVDGVMDREIIESIAAKVTVHLQDHRGKTLFQATSGEAGMEISC